MPPTNRTLLEINARVWLNEQPWARDARDLAFVPDATLDDWAALGIDWIWMMGVWEPSPAGRAIGLSHAGLQAEFRAALPDLRDEDVVGSPYCIRDYSLNPALGVPGEGPDATLPRLRRRLNERGMCLMLDFVPNHMALDHPWVAGAPERFVRGTDDDLRDRPGEFFRAPGGAAIACGRDPYFAPWTDVAQIDYFNPDAAEAMRGELERIARVCDGVRCDMAMLVVNEVFDRTWGERARRPDGPPPEFWPSAVERVRRSNPDFAFMAEVYWDMEWSLQRMGFDWTYDKTLYDRLERRDGGAVRGHLLADLDYQSRSARFVENHDEPRAAATLGPTTRAAALVCQVAPGLAFHHEGQWEGRRVRVPVQLARRPDEPPDAALAEWHRRLLLATRESPWRDGSFRSLEPRPAWEGNPSHGSVVAIWRSAPGGARGLAVANLALHRSQCYADLPAEEFREDAIRLTDRLSDAVHDRPTAELRERGLYLDLAPGEAHLFAIEAAPPR